MPERQRNFGSICIQGACAFWICKGCYVSGKFSTCSHHSHDPGLLRRVQGAMASMKAQPWKCVDCRRLVKGSVLYCSGCGHHWEECMDRIHQEAEADRIIPQPGIWHFLGSMGSMRTNLFTKPLPTPAETKITSTTWRARCQGESRWEGQEPAQG